MITTLFSHISITEIITMTIIHSLWQAPVIAFSMYSMLRIKKSASSNYKYNVALSALSLIVLTTLFTVIYYVGQQYIFGIDPDFVTYVQRSDRMISSTILSGHSDFGIWDQIMLYDQRITISWLIGVSIFMIKYIIGLAGLSSIRRSIDYKIPDWVQHAFDRIETKTKKVIRIAQSDLIESPMMIGFFKPIIIFPLATINQLSPEEVEAIIVHEIGHILRNDFIQNLLIIIAESIFFYNPAVWWISKILKEERENACDDLVLLHGLNNMSYAKTLLKLQELSNTKNNQLASNLFNKNSLLMNRIKRILNQPVTLSYLKERGISIVLFAIGILTLTSSKVMKPMIEEINPVTSLSLSPIQEIKKLHHKLPKQVVKTIIETDTIPEESPNTARYEWKQEKLDELNERQQEVYKRYRNQIKSIEKELREKTLEYNDAVKQKLEKLNKHSEKHYDKYEREDFGEKIGKEFSLLMEDSFSREWVRELEELGERLERDIGDVSKEIDIVINEEWLNEIADMGQEISQIVVESMDEDMLEDITEMSLAIASEAMEGIGKAFDEIDFNYHYDSDLKTRLAE